MNPSGLFSVSSKDKGLRANASVLDLVDDVCEMGGSKIDTGGLGLIEVVAASVLRGKLKNSEKPDEHFGEIKVKGKKKKAPAVALRQSAQIKRDGVPIQMKGQLRADLKDDTTVEDAGAFAAIGRCGKSQRTCLREDQGDVCGGKLIKKNKLKM
ncbi:hypothetical protein GUJ93_ZPchr0009g2013 [Zizania palustris]|uniref:Uncharacterized protein n=1 Tax=Zizania palustris TaxID=103762 RepID=A0A8J5VIB5_ZIZPA|nr:hypothetical protein GUJ93_ZPchr0009g2013 [Zizania palustris]